MSSSQEGGKCPFTGHTSKINVAGGGTSNSDWWPNQIKVSLLRQNSSLSDPMDPDFDYAAAFSSLDYAALKEDIKKVMTDVDSFKYLEPKADPFRNYKSSASSVSTEALLIDKAQ